MANASCPGETTASINKASESAGGDPCKAGLLIALPGGGCDLHPSPLGHLVLAGAVGQAFLHWVAPETIAGKTGN